MAAERQIPGGSFVNETGTAQRQIPGGVFANETVSSGVTGTLAYTNANDTLSAAGTTTVTGTLAKTNADDTLSAAGTTTVVGTLAYTNANDTISASGAVGSDITGTVNYTNADDTLSAAGTTTVTGTVAYTNANDTLSGAGSPIIVGDLAHTNSNDTLSASGAAGTVTGTLDYTNANDTLDANGQSGDLLVIGGKGDNDGVGYKKKKKSIYKPTGIINRVPEKKKTEKEKIVEARAEETSDIAKLVAEETKKAFDDGVLYKKPIDKMTLSEIDSEIGILMKDKLNKRDEEDIMALLALIAEVA